MLVKLVGMVESCHTTPWICLVYILYDFLLTFDKVHVNVTGSWSGIVNGRHIYPHIANSLVREHD